MNTYKLRAVGIVAALTSACTIGPNFQRPLPPSAEYFTAWPQPTVTAEAPGPGGAAQHFQGGEDVPPHWWTLFQCEAVDRLVQDSLDNSPTVAQARARLLQAQEEFKAQSGATRYPALDAQLGHDGTNECI